MKLRLPSKEITLYTIVVLAMLTSALSIAGFAATTARQSDQIQCNSDYNEADGLARDERASRASADTVQERRTWKKLYKQFSAPPQGGETGSEEDRREEFLRTIRGRVESLNKTLQTQAQNPYPAYDACADGKMTEEEGKAPTS